MKKHLRSKVIIVVIIVVLLIDFSCVVLNYRKYVSVNNEYMLSLAGTVANTCTLVVDGDMITEYLSSGQRTTQYYEIWNKLIDYRNTSSNIVELSVVSFDEEGGHFVFDTDLSTEGAFLGDYYSLDSRQKEVESQLIACADSLTIDYNDYTEIYIPVKSSYNIPVAYLIVGIYTKDFKTDQIWYLVKLGALITAITLMSGLVLIIFMNVCIVRHINRMTDAAAHYVDNLDKDQGISPLQQINIHTGDELERLLESMKKMENDIFNAASSLAVATWNSNHDSMTQLYNKRYYQQTLENMETVEDMGIIYFDIDNLKKMNDIYGHDRGDAVINKTADFIRKYERENASGFRIGGDEFVMVISKTAKKDIEELLDEMHRDEDGFLDRQITEFCCRIAIGGTFRQHGESLEETIKRAEALMYGDKHAVRE